MTTGTRGLVAAVGASLLGHVVPTVVLRPVARGLRGRVHPRVEAYVRSRNLLTGNVTRVALSTVYDGSACL